MQTASGTPMTEETMWQAVVERDRTQGSFFFGVVTTGIVCRPGCTARTPLRRNVRFFRTLHEAQQAGLRACLRCRPGSTPALAAHELITAVRSYIRTHADQPRLVSLAALGRRFALSPSHLQRSFKAATGTSPKQYAQEIRMQTLRKDLRNGATVTAALYDAGFGSSSRLYEHADAQLGMTPGQFRSHGRGVEITFATMPTPLGLLMLAATDRGLCFVQFGASAEALLEALAHEFSAATLRPIASPPPAAFHQWMQHLGSYLKGEATLAALPLAPHGTAFQQKVWRYLETIPSGEVQTYTDVARGIGQPRAVRAVASACAANPVALLVPCHRVIRGDGGMGGYRWGLDRKRALLQTEQTLGPGAAPSPPQHDAPPVAL